VRRLEFTEPPVLRPYRSQNSNRLYTLMNAPAFIDADGVEHKAVRGMLTDLASIPTLADGLFSNVDHRGPGVIHDAGYMLSKVTGAKRADLDRLFEQMCLTQGATSLQGQLLRTGLELGGWHSWDECQQTGVTWADFDISVLSDEEIADYRVRFNIADNQLSRLA
jgi:hypothetical protein